MRVRVAYSDVTFESRRLTTGFVPEVELRGANGPTAKMKAID